MKLSIDTDKNSVIITQKFSVKIETLWNSYTQSSLLDRFWAPDPWVTETQSMDFREGGTWVYSLTNPDGEVQMARLDYFQIHPLKRFKAVDSFIEEDGTIEDATSRAIWDVSFELVGNETLVTEIITFASAYHLNTTLEMGFEQGVKMVMRNLETALKASNIKQK